jgi:alkylation response protein AidB-like acyl-CoA dehydrogenase
MLAVLSEEQQMLGQVATDLADRIGIRNPGDLESTSRQAGWSEIAKMGLCGLRLRNPQGKPMASGVDVMIVAEALAAHLTPQPYLGVTLFPSELLALSGAPAEVQSRVGEGSARICMLLSPDLRSLSSSAGGEALAWDCEGAEFALGLSSQTGRVMRYPVISLEPLEAADLTRLIAKVQLGPAEDICSISSSDLDRWHAFVLSVVSADIVGAMRGGLNGAVAYSKDRVQFGSPIGSFQALQHLCSEALVKIEGAASTVKYAAWAIDELQPADALLAARTAKAYAAGVAREVGETVMQVYGGIGQTWEHIAHFYLRRQMVSSQVLGDASTQLLAIADARLGAV